MRLPVMFVFVDSRCKDSYSCPLLRLTCYSHPRSPKCTLCCLLSNILTFWMLLCGHIFNRLLIVWCESVSTTFADISVCTQTHTHTHKCMLWLSQTGAGISCATTEVESESRWSRTVAFYTNGENSHCPPETHSMHSKGYIEIRKLIHLAKT